MLASQLDQARSLQRTGRTAEAIAEFEAAEQSARTPVERATVLPFLCGAYEKAGRLDEALRVGRLAVEAAEGVADDTVVAHAKLSLGSALFARFFRDGPADPDWSVFKEAMSLSEAASQIYEHAGKIDYASALLIMAEAYRTVDILDGAGALWVRVVKELSKEPWLPPESEVMERQIDYLRGRAWMGLGYVALQCIDQHEARRRFDIAVDLLLSGEPEIFKADIEEIADIFARDLGDEQAAEQLRQIAERAASA
jgi:tetratricopeptide (TPR) repeat protein